MSVELKIKTGTIGVIKRKGLFVQNIRLLYSGMPNNQTFTMTPVVKEESISDGFGFTPVIYYHIESTKINILENEYKVIDVNKDWIVLQPIKS